MSQYLWTTGVYYGGAIKYDLDWIANYFIGNATCDMWSTLWGTEFFWNYYNSRKAMLLGASFATKMGDIARAVQYSTVANQIEVIINSTFLTGDLIIEST